MGDPYGAGALLGLRKFLLLQRCTPFTRLLLLMSLGPINMTVGTCSKDWMTLQPPC